MPSSRTGERRTLHLGVTPWRSEGDGSAALLVAQARQAEAWGYDSFFLPESHFQPRGGRPQPLLQLAAIAAGTERIRLGTTSLLLPIRSPLLVAEEVAVLDRLSAGRVILGLGRGFRESLFDAFGVAVAEKRSRFESALRQMVSAWHGEPVARSPDGSGQSRPLFLDPLPVQRPHPPLWIAAFGPKALAQVGGLDLPYLSSPLEPLSRLVENYRLHRESRPGGATSNLAVPVMRTVFSSDDAGLRARVEKTLIREVQELRRARAGQLRGRLGASVDEWALVGGSAALPSLVEVYRREIGLTHLIVRAPSGGRVDREEVERSLEAIPACLGARP